MRLTHPHFPDVLPEDRFLLTGAAVPDDSDTFRLDQTVRASKSNLTSRKFSHYELLEIIGEGQFGTVWRAKDQRLDRIVALKVPHLLDWDDVRRTLFLREARAAATLEHPHIVRVHGIDQDGDQLAIISQFIEGQTLFHLLQDRPLTFAEAAQMLAAIAEAVHHAHEAGVIHRDLKPSNILLDAELQPHVSDFGLAKWSGDQATLTNPGLVLGTPAYMSPEQARGDSHNVDRRSDVYSLGVLLYEMLTGKPPFEGNSTLLLLQVQSQDPRAPRSINATIPPDLETICLKCLAKAPEGRYATAQELADDLRRFLAGEPIAARPVSLAERFVSWTRRNPTMAASLVVSALSTFAAVGLGISAASLSGPKQTSAAELLPRSIEVSLATDPPGATVVFYPLEELTGAPDLSKAVRPSEKSPVHLDLLSGDYLVVTALDDGRFHEVYRRVPRYPSAVPDYYPHRNWERLSETAVSLFPVTIPSARSDQGMTVLADQQSTDSDHAGRALIPFLLDQQEVTVSDFLREFHDQLPPSMRGRRQSLLVPNYPITGLFFDEAMTYAEVVGKRLPTSLEYEFAATNGWTTRFPWGDTEPPAEAWTLTSAGANTFDRTRNDSPIFGLFSNATEFVSTPFLSEIHSPHGTLAHPESRASLFITLRGGPIATAKQPGQPFVDSLWRSSSERTLLSEQVGFRCAKSKSPRL